MLAISRTKNYRVWKPVSSLLSAAEIYISNKKIISMGKTLFMLVCFDLIYIKLYSLNWILILSELAQLLSSSTRNFSSRFQLCFDFAMHHGSLYCPFKCIETHLLLIKLQVSTAFKLYLIEIYLKTLLPQVTLWL